MPRSFRALGVGVALLAATLGPATAASAATSAPAAAPLAAAVAPPLPDSMAAIGDSITQAVDVCCFYGNWPGHSWATGYVSVTTARGGGGHAQVAETPIEPSRNASTKTAWSSRTRTA